MQKRKADAAAPAAVDWKALHARLAQMKFSERNLKGATVLVEASDACAFLLRTKDKMDYYYMRADNVLLCQLVTMAAQYFPVEEPAERTVAFVNEACNLYSYLGVRELSGFHKRVYALQPQRDTTARWFWANVMAHLLFAASLPPAVAEQKDGYWHLVCLAARYAGPVYEQFIMMLLAVFMVVGMDPRALPEMITRWFLPVFVGRYHGRLEENFYYQIKKVQ